MLLNKFDKQSFSKEKIETLAPKKDRPTEPTPVIKGPASPVCTNDYLSMKIELVTVPPH